MTVTAHDIDRELRTLGLAEAAADLATHARLAEHGLRLLPALADYLSSDLPIAVLERYEALLKAVLRRELDGEVSGETARAVAAFQLQVGLLMKYKSYAVKASSPLGYSIFLQNPGEGFSFQRHLTHKTEVFHILDAHPGGFVYLSSYDDWRRDYDRNRFADWLAGQPDAAYERFRIPAHPGDVFILDQLNIVHTVVGCTLEEFATISTDMVDRLHDQNQGRPIPAAFVKPWVHQRLAGLRNPPSSRVVAAGLADLERRHATPATPAAAAAGAHADAAAASSRHLRARAIQGGTRTVLATGFVDAAQYSIQPRGETAPQSDPRCAASLYVRSGRGRVLLGSAAELARPTAPGLAVAARDLLTVPQGIWYALVNEGDQPLEVVEHRIRPEVALH
jgi:mannose-6-phosphate isomerase-like protein (cupin superfamily)